MTEGLFLEYETFSKLAPNSISETNMATILACIRASPLALRPLRPLASIRSYSDKKDDGEAGSPLDGKKLSLNELLEKTKIQKPVEPIKLQSVKPPRRAPEKVPDLDARTARLAERAAENIPGDVEQNLNELLGQLREVSKESRENLEDLLLGMRIDRSKGRSRPDSSILDADEAEEQSHYFGRADANRMQTYRSLGSGQGRASFQLFSESRLDVFSADAPNGIRGGCSLPIWDQLLEKDIKLMLTTSPRNGFEEMIRWTEEGKLWPFPINNEHGMLEEANVSFEDHVFLDHLIEDDHAFPPGPVRQFMELVCVGLSKNPYISVERKHRCIEWYRDYLTSKKKLIEASVEL